LAYAVFFVTHRGDVPSILCNIDITHTKLIARILSPLN